MISALPPKAKITALVCSGRSRPKFRMPCRNSKFSCGKASWQAMTTPTRNPTTPQNAVAITPARITPSIVFVLQVRQRRGSPALRSTQRKAMAAASITTIALTMIGQVVRVVGCDRGGTATQPNPTSFT